MVGFGKHIEQLRQQGYAVAPTLYSPEELNSIENLLTTYIEDQAAHQSSLPLYAIRKLLKKIPQLKPLMFNKSLLRFLDELIGADAFLTKSIYFDKPEHSNWFVSFHQDLSISVKDKIPKEGYINWTRKKEVIGVQPPREVLEHTYTLRLHLDYTDASNGGLMVVPGSHKKGIVRIDREKETFTDIISPTTARGELLLMQPLTIHASKRATAMKRRRVIHMEFSNVELAPGLAWDELETLNIATR